MGDDKDLDVTDHDLTHLATGIGKMRDHLGDQVRRMTTLVDTIEGGWQSDAGDGYREVHLRVAKDVVRVGELLGVVEEAVRLSRDGFTNQESDTLRRMNQEAEHVDATAEAKHLMAPPRSRILDV
ncbi:WXG100 family type VII secretion target [Streptomyces sp. 8L]|uniref:WXG100 family type VII secretion target n=1 Tax=unclassified Streptomyces TaxID=2593676 RepID=UPI001CD25743|nr:WXG100 family type VII secretion target [Streptomyces sp. 8L]MCA1221950.1 WXG100 family type VII secretion target [Streptomyces sp. 8L]